MRTSFFVITTLIGFLAGVLLYLVMQPPLNWLFCINFLFIPLFLSFRFKKPLFCILFLFIISLGLGLTRATFCEHFPTPLDVDFYNEQRMELEGVITEVDIRRDQAKYRVKVKNYSLQDGTSVSGGILISLLKYPQYHYGDRIRIYGELKTPVEFDGFSYKNYLSRYDLYSVMYEPRVTFITSGEGSFFWSGMTIFQNTFMERINRIFPEPYASFEAGLLIGARKGIPPDLMEQFNITGLTHIIAISGYNITIIIVFVLWMLKGLSRRMGFVVAIGAIVLFTIFVGASPAVVRASIMGILGLAALNYGRQSNIHITILFTAFLMILWNPKILWWDVGFQLSFMAVMGLIYAAPLFEKISKKLPEAFGVREAITMTISAQVMALPVIIFNFERLSLISPISNLLVSFAIPPAMLFGFVAVIFSFVFYPLSMLFGYLAWGVLSYIIKVIEWTSQIPYASVDLPGMRLWMLFGYYIALILFLIWVYKRRKLKMNG